MSAAFRRGARISLLVLVLAPAAWAGGVAKARKLLDAHDYEGAIALLDEALARDPSAARREELDALLDDAFWGRAEAAGTEASYQQYRDARPTGAHQHDAIVRGCALAWTAAQAAAGSTDPGPIRTFAETHRACPEFPVALREASRRSFAAAQRVGTAVAMEAYLAEWPDGPDAAAARAAADDLSFAEASADPGVDGLAGYLRRHPTGAHLAEAAASLEARSWEAARSTEGVAGLLSFVSAFPASAHTSEARQLVRQRQQGLFRLQGGDWVPIGEESWVPGTLVYKPPPGGAPAASLQIWGLHVTPAGEVPSPVASLLGHWAAGPLGLDPRILETPSFRPSAPGPAGEVLFEVPVELPRWAWSGAQLVAYEARVLDASGAPLATQRLLAGSGTVPLEPFLGGGSTPDANAFPRDPTWQAALAALRVLAADYPGAAKAWGAARERWPDLPRAPAGLSPAWHTGAVYLAYGDRTTPPGADGNGFVPFYSASSGKFSLTAPSSGGGTLLLDDGKPLGIAQLNGSSVQPEWYLERRRALGGSVTLEKRPLPKNFLDHPLFLLSPAERAPVAATGGLESFLARFPSLRAAAGDNPTKWMAEALQRAGVTAPVGPFDLGNNGIPTYVGVVKSKFAVVHVSLAGRATVVDTPFYPNGDAAFRFLTDVDGDGAPEAVLWVPGSCSGMQAIVIRERSGRTFADAVTASDDCD